MSKKEKDAIERIKRILYMFPESEELKILLNLIEKQQEKIESQKNTLELYSKNYGLQRDKIEKLSKIINLMAEDRAEIGEPKVSAEAIKLFYFGKVEDDEI